MNTKVSKKSYLKNQIKKIGTAGLVSSTCIGFFHEVPVPDSLKKLQADLAKTK
jgi:cyclic lactone autoinducer peptide